MFKINKIAAGIALAGSVSALMPMVSYAEESLALEEVTVTARKRAESLQDLALSVTSITAQLDNAAVLNIQDLETFAPNVNIDDGMASAGAATISIRGMSQQDPDKSLESPVGVVLDGVALGTTAGQMLDTFDLVQVEILRGPQGTLFGKNTTGGALIATRSKPTGELGGKIKAGVTDFGGREIRALVNTPLSDRGGLKLTATQVKDDGYMHNTTLDRKVGGKDFESFGFAVSYDITDSFDVLFSYDKINDNSQRGAFSNFNDDSSIACLASNLQFLFPAAAPVPVGSGCMSTDTDSDENNVSTNGMNLGSIDDEFATLAMNWNLADWQVTSITGYQDRYEDSVYEWDSSQADVITVFGQKEYSQLSEELRINGSLTENINLTAGVYYFEADYAQDQQSHDMWYYLAQLDPGLAARFGSYGPGDVRGDVESTGGNEVKAIFASMDWALSEKMSLNLAARYTEEEKTFQGWGISSWVSKTSGVIEPFENRKNLQEDWSEFSPRVALQYAVNDDLMVFGSYATGFKSGGFFARTTDVEGLDSFDPEYIDTIEVGVKSEWMDGRVRVNATAFHSGYDDKQEDILIPTGPGEVNSHIKNAGTAEIKGLELEVQAQITTGLSAYMMVGMLDTEYTDFTADITGDGIETDNSHLTFRNAPEKTFGMGFDYVQSLSVGEFSANYSYRWSDEYETEFFNDPRSHADAMGIHNVSLSLSIDDKYTLSLYGRNLTDERHARLVKIGGIAQGGTWSTPRNLGASFTVDF